MKNKYSSIIDSLILLNQNNRVGKQREAFSLLQWLLSFCIVAVDIGRGVGKTEYIKSNYRPKKDLIVVSSVRNKELYKRHIDDADIVIPEPSKHFYYELNRNYNTVFVDEPLNCFENKDDFLDFLICIGKKEIDQTIVMLGRAF